MDGTEATPLCTAFPVNDHDNTHTYTHSTAIAACDRGGAWNVALSMLDEARDPERGPGANVFAYTAAMSACGRAGQWEKAFGLLDVSNTCFLFGLVWFGLVWIGFLLLFCRCLLFFVFFLCFFFVFFCIFALFSCYFPVIFFIIFLTFRFLFRFLCCMICLVCSYAGANVNTDKPTGHAQRRGSPERRNLSHRPPRPRKRTTSASTSRNPGTNHNHPR